MLRRLRLRLPAAFARSAFEADMADELRAHLEMRVEALIASGLEPEAARRQARLEFGSPEAYKDRCRDARRLTPIDSGSRALRQAFRSLRHAPGYVALVLLTLSLVSGTHVVVFALASALWLGPRAVADPDRLVVVSSLTAAADSLPADASPPMSDILRDGDLELLREQDLFEGVAGQVAGRSMFSIFLRPRLTNPATGREVETVAVTPEYFTVLGLPIRGRHFTTEDDQPLAPPVAIISDRLWRTAFDGRDGVVGETIQAGSGPVQIVGIAPRDFHGARRGEQVDAWVPRRMAGRLGGFARAFAIWPDQPGILTGPYSADPPMLALARLRPGVTPSQAQERLSETVVRSGESWLGSARLLVRPLGAVYGTPDVTTLDVDEQLVWSVIALMAGLVLLAGCATLAAIVLVHYERRRRELVIRLALGSSRRRLAGALAGEMIVLAMAGAAGAAVVAHWTLALLPALTLPGGVELGRLDLRVDAMALGVATAASAVAICAAGVVPLVRFTRPSLAADLSASAQTTAPSLLRFRRTLLGVHAAATLLLVVCAGLFVQTMTYGFTRGAGFDADRTLFLRAEPNVLSLISDDGDESRMAQRRRARYEQLLAELRALPGVRAVVHGGPPLRLLLPEYPLPDPIGLSIDGVTHERRILWHSAAPGYAAALGLPVLAGRALRDEDLGTGHVLMTRSLALSLWPDGGAVGGTAETSRPWDRHLEVVGIVPDFAQGSLRSGLRDGIIRASALSITAETPSFFEVTIATSPPADVLADEVRRAAERVFSSADALTVVSGRDLVARDLGRARLGAWFFSAFGLVALGLGLASVFGLVAYATEARRRELGVRLALGATPRRLMWNTVAAGLWPVAIGAAAGLALTASLAGGVAVFLHGVGRLDPPTYAGAFLLLMAGALLAGGLAARRILRVSPIEILRPE